MRERPILFSAEMVRAILKGRKTQTRRIVKAGTRDDWNACPYGVIGDRLWVRETWASDRCYDHLPPSQIPQSTGIYYAVNTQRLLVRGWHKARSSMFMPRWASRITLEITGVRVERLQAITEVDAIAEGVESPEVERYDFDRALCGQCGGTRLYTSFATNGGAMPDTDCEQCDTYRKRFRNLWDSINGKRASWESNPWVWVVEFNRAEVAA